MLYHLRVGSGRLYDNWRKEGLAHDAALLRLEPVENHALVRGVLVDKQHLLAELGNDVSIQNLAHDAKFRRLSVLGKLLLSGFFDRICRNLC